MRLFLYIDKGCEVQKNKEVYHQMPRNLSANSPLQSILLKHQLALERAIRQLAQAVGNRPPEREEIAGFFQDLIDGGWDAYEEAVDEMLQKTSTAYAPCISWNLWIRNMPG